MSICFTRSSLVYRGIFSGVGGLFAIAAAVLIAMPMSAAAGEPYDPPNDVAAYQTYRRQTYGQPRPPQTGYFESPSHVRRNELLARLNYAEAQYHRARQAGDRVAAKHWKRDIKHLKREIAGAERVRGSGYGAPGYVMPPQEAPYPPSASAYGSSAYASPMIAYPQPYPSSMPPYGFAGAPPAPYPSVGYPTSGYAYAVGSPYGAPAATGTAGGLGSLLGPLLGGGSVPSGAQYPQTAYPGATAGAPAATGSMGGLGSLLGPLLGGSSTP